MIRAAAGAFIVMAGVAFATPALAHASLLSSYPPDSILLEAAPGTLALTFNEPVSVTELQLIDATGVRHALPDAHLEGSAVVASLPTGLPNGTDALSWRVVSADGHPIGGTVVFSIGKVTAGPAVSDRTTAPGLYPLIWLVGLILFGGQFVGVGGSFFATWIAPLGALPTRARQIITAALVSGIIAGVLSLGLEGVDALGREIADLGDAAPWAAGLATSYAGMVIVSEIAFVAALVAIRMPELRMARILSGVGLLATGVAISLTGHASDAQPQTLSWVAVFLHTVGVAFWIGCLIPLGLLVWKPSGNARVALLRFSRAIPFAIVPLVFAGVLLTVVQFTSIADFWTTDYGRILALKLVAVLGLFSLAAVNRFVFTDRAVRGDGRGMQALRRSIGIEIGLVVVILGLVELWRFIPPPRTVAAVLAALSAPASTHAMAPTAMADVTVTPGRAGPVRMTLNLIDTSFNPILAKEVSVDLANPVAGIEPITKMAVRTADGSWQVDALDLPVAGMWRITVNALITDFSETSMEGSLSSAGDREENLRPKAGADSRRGRDQSLAMSESA